MSCAGICDRADCLVLFILHYFRPVWRFVEKEGELGDLNSSHQTVRFYSGLIWWQLTGWQPTHRTKCFQGHHRNLMPVQSPCGYKKLFCSDWVRGKKNITKEAFEYWRASIGWSHFFSSCVYNYIPADDLSLTCSIFLELYIYKLYLNPYVSLTWSSRKGEDTVDRTRSQPVKHATSSHLCLVYTLPLFQV